MKNKIFAVLLCCVMLLCGCSRTTNVTDSVQLSEKMKLLQIELENLGYKETKKFFEGSESTLGMKVSFLNVDEFEYDYFRYCKTGYVLKATKLKTVAFENLSALPRGVFLTFMQVDEIYFEKGNSNLIRPGDIIVINDEGYTLTEGRQSFNLRIASGTSILYLASSEEPTVRIEVPRGEEHDLCDVWGYYYGVSVANPKDNTSITVRYVASEIVEKYAPTPVYQKPIFYIAIAASVVVVSGAILAVVIVKKKSKKKAEISAE